jgi:hypothetical protein
MTKSQKEYGRFLTDTQRDYLNGLHDPPSDNAEYQIRSKIRARTEGALEEFDSVGKLTDDDAKKVFEGVGEITTDGTTITTPEGSRDIMPGHEAELIKLVAFAYRGFRENKAPADYFISALKAGIRQGEANRHNVSPNNVSIDLELNELTVHTDVNSMDPLEKYEAGVALTREDWQELGTRLSDELGRSVGVDEMPELIDKYLVDSDDE